MRKLEYSLFRMYNQGIVKSQSKQDYKQGHEKAIVWFLNTLKKVIKYFVAHRTFCPLRKPCRLIF